MKSESELSDKEWRQMRRQMPKLEFEPVPETPALLPRSLYGESDKELAAICEEHEKPEETFESAVIAADASSNHNDSPTNRRCMGISPGRESSVVSAPTRSAIPDSNPDDINQKQAEKDAIKIRGELPSTSMAVSPLVTNRYRLRDKRPPAKPDLDDADIAVLDAQLAMAQEAARRSIMSAFMELRLKKAKNEALERSKLSAAHMTDVAALQSKVEELKMRVAESEAKREQQELLFDRFSEFTAKQSHHNQMRWCEAHWLGKCFRGWSTSAQQAAARSNALRRVLGQCCRRQLLASFCRWKQNLQAFGLQNQLQEQRERYEHRIVEMAKEYQLKIQQLQQEIDDAKCQVAESHKCRQKLEEDLRLIFLRGVSAMNIEALTAFGSSHKVNHKSSGQERLIPSSRQHQSSSTQAMAPIKSPTAAPSKTYVPVTPAPEEVPPPTPSLHVEATAPAPIVTPDSGSVRSTSTPVSVSRPNSSRAPLYHGWSRPTSTSELRSAEMIRQHELSLPVGRQSSGRSAFSSYRPYSAPSPTRKKPISQSNAKYQVEMQFVRSAIATSAARASGGNRTRPVSVTRSAAASTRSRR